MLTVREQQHSFSTRERMFLWKCQGFWDRKCVNLRGTRTPNLRIHVECSNHLTYQGQTFAVTCLWILGLAVNCCAFIIVWDAITLISTFVNGGIDIFEVKLTFEMLTVRGQQHSFSTYGWMFLWKCQSFWDRKCLHLRGNQTPNLRIHAECSYHLSYQGQTFAVPCLWILGLAVNCCAFIIVWDAITLISTAV